MQKNKNIQPQAEPYIVKSHDIHIDADWIAGSKHRYLFFAENIEKLKLFVSIIGAELVNSKLHQPAGELQFAVNQGVMSQAKNNWQNVCVSCKSICKKQNE